MTPQTITIKVDRTEVSARGQKNNKPWVKYLVFGTRADGSPIASDGLPVYTFDKLGTGPVEVELDQFVKGRAAFHESWTVRRVKQDGPKAARPAGGDTSSLQAQVDALTERVDDLEAAFARLMTKNRIGSTA